MGVRVVMPQEKAYKIVKTTNLAVYLTRVSVVVQSADCLVLLSVYKKDYLIQ